MTAIEKKQGKKTTAELFLILVMLFGLAIFSISKSPESAEPITAVLKSFLDVYYFPLAGVVSALLL